MMYRLTGWGRLDDLVALNYELGVVEELQELAASLAGESYIPDWFVHMALQFRSYVGDESINGMQTGLFKDVGVLRMLGVTAVELREGFDAARNGGEHTPCHVDSLRYHVQGMELLRDMQGLAKLSDDACKVTVERKGEQDSQGKHLEEVKVMGFSELTSLDSYAGEVNGVLVVERRGKVVSGEAQWGFLTTKSVRTEAEVLAVYDGYDDRSLIENRVYRESKQGYEITRFIGKDDSSIAAHLFYETLSYNMIGMYHHQGSRQLIALGIRRLRREVFGEQVEVLVVVGDSFATFELLEFLELLGRSPTGALDGVRLQFA